MESPSQAPKARSLARGQQRPRGPTLHGFFMVKPLSSLALLCFVFSNRENNGNNNNNNVSLILIITQTTAGSCENQGWGGSCRESLEATKCNCIYPKLLMILFPEIPTLQTVSLDKRGSTLQNAPLFLHLDSTKLGSFYD